MSIVAAELLPVSVLAAPLGFVPLTGMFYFFVAVATLMYLLLVPCAKAVLWRQAESSSPRT